MPEQDLFLVAGLGNPGPEYAHTRHSIGFMVLDALAAKFRIKVQRRKFDVLFGKGRIGGAESVLAKPQAFMNCSGPPLRQVADFFRIYGKQMIIVHDDIDLPLQRLKIKEKGGDGGHKGIRSIIQAFGGGDFIRVRLGVGRSPSGAAVVDHVLSAFDREETAARDDLIRMGCQAVETILAEGARKAMNQFNQSLR